MPLNACASLVRRLLTGAIAVAALACVATGHPRAQTSKPVESQVKAAYLLNFGRFATWPTPAKNTGGFTVCVLGRDPFGSVLESTIAGERIGGLPVVARRIQETGEATPCRVLFISASERSRLRETLGALEGLTALTVSDIPEFLDTNGMIQFVMEGNRVRFTVNAVAAERAGLTFGSELLRVAVSVKTAEPGGRR